MKTKIQFALIAALVLLALHRGAAQGTAFTYQGRLASGTNGATGVFDLTFALFNVSSGAGQVGPTLTNSPTGVTNGLFNVTLDFGAGQFPGAGRWLEIGVRTNGGGAFTTLTPRQRLTATPYAITASNVTGVVPSGSVSGTYGSAVTFNNAANSFSGAFSGNGGGLTNVNALTLGGLGSSNFWKTGGNGGTSAGTNFLGTTDNQPLELKVNGARALRLEPAANVVGLTNIVNVVGGSSVNYVGAGIVGATIGGGGAGNYFGARYTNSVLANFGTVGGGVRNTSSGDRATVGGGHQNTSSGENATTGGGQQNTSGGLAATTGGGQQNTSSGENATTGGGQQNTSSGDSATVPGGLFNTAAGNYSLAAGYRAKANHQGAFVWGDSQDADFSSTAGDQFLIRALGGVGIGKTNPATALDVNGTVTAVTFSGIGSSLTALSAANLSSGTVPDARLAANIARTNQVWLLAGNLGTTPGTDFLGTRDNQALELKVNNTRALRLEPNSAGAPNVVGGSPYNFVGAGVVGATIAGGGAITYIGSSLTNRVAGDFGVIGGGHDNSVGSQARGATIAGGRSNRIGTNSYDAAIGGGDGNDISDNAPRRRLPAAREISIIRPSPRLEAATSTRFKPVLTTR